VDVVPVTRRALISVSDKTGIVEFATYLSNHGVEILSTGGTAVTLRAAGLPVVDVATYTGATECLNGRVKTLHPKIHGGLLAVRGNVQHEREMLEQDILPIDLTIMNLYPFEKTISQKDNDTTTFEQCIENIDIGGPSMLRSTAKNHAYTTIVTSPHQYSMVQREMERSRSGTGTTLALRRTLAAAAFALSAAYDSAIATWFAQQLEKEQQAASAASVAASTSDASSSSSSSSTAALVATIKPVVTRAYQPEFTLKYGCNPHQNPAQILSRLGQKLPFTVVNGMPGYINLLDAANAWQLVLELKQATGGLAAAASFKHVSPAGAAVAVPLDDTECLAYEVSRRDADALTPVALAYLRARNADPMCSFGDFCAVSDVVDEDTAKILQKEVSDGIVAPGYTPEAMAILQKKKGGKYIILQATPDYDGGGDIEYREVYGMVFSQKRNDVVIGKQHLQNVVTAQGKDALTDAATRDLILASICIKYTQSNSVGFAKNGMMVGVGAGQQSRVDCVKLAGRKVATWYLRQHDKVLGLQFQPGVKRQDRVNARVRYIEGDFTAEERVRWESQFATIPEPLTKHEKASFLATNLTGVALSSDAFFPFRDSIDHASKLGVTYVAQPGGSVQDDQVTEACNEYGMTMCSTKKRKKRIMINQNKQNHQ
jgi:phosphoribosylaminoimidazolecarboxamide formyltransferase / IMP cyclohydrolase